MLIGLIVSSVLYLRSERERTAAMRMNYIANVAAADMALRLADVPTAQNRLLRTDPAMRSFEWGLLWHRSDSSLATLYTDSLSRPCPGCATRLCRSPTTLRGSDWGSGDAIHVSNAQTYAPIQVHGGFGTVLAIARDGRDVLAFRRKSLSLIDLASEAVLANLKFGEDDEFDLRVRDVSPSGAQIATGTSEGRFRVWDVASAAGIKWTG